MINGKLNYVYNKANAATRYNRAAIGDYKKLMEKIIELEKIRDLRPDNMWSYSVDKTYTILFRVNKTYAKRYKELKKELKRRFYNDVELYPKIKQLPRMYLLTNNRFEIIFLSIAMSRVTSVTCHVLSASVAARLYRVHHIT